MRNPSAIPDDKRNAPKRKNAAKIPSVPKIATLTILGSVTCMRRDNKSPLRREKIVKTRSELIPKKTKIIKSLIEIFSSRKHNKIIYGKTATPKKKSSKGIPQKPI